MTDRFAAELDKCKTISLEILQEKVNQLSSDTRKRTLNESDALHYVCTKQGVTVEILEYILEINPDIQYDDVSSRFGKEYKRTYPLHLACQNQYCPGSVIEFLMNMNPEGLKILSIISQEFLIKVQSAEDMWGLPLSFYLARKSNVDLDIVQKMVSASRGFGQKLSRYIGFATAYHCYELEY